MNASNRNLSILAILSLLLNSATYAELRTWTDSDGNKIQAELLENLNGNVTLLRENGREAHIKISQLSAADQKYVLVNSPPKIDISVNEVTSRENKGFSFDNDNSSRSDDRDYQIQTSTSHYKVTLKKSGTIPYKDSIQAELYVFGYKKQEDAFVLLTKEIQKFTFGEGETKDKYTFTSNQVVTQDLQGNRKAGTDYFGNMVVLLDSKGRIFKVKGSRSRMQEFTALIRKMKQDQVITKAELQSAQNEAK
jgi:hypothetical protein